MTKSSNENKFTPLPPSTQLHSKNDILSYLSSNEWPSIGERTHVFVIEREHVTAISKQSKGGGDQIWELWEHYARFAAGLFWTLVLFHILFR